MELPQLPPKPLLCINCEHYANRSLRFGEDASLMARCSAPQNFKDYNLVSGDPQYSYPTCHESRSDVPHGDSCGPFAKWFHVRLPTTKQSATTTKTIEDAERNWEANNLYRNRRGRDRRRPA
jgi:hypothetical protein